MNKAVNIWWLLPIELGNHDVNWYIPPIGNHPSYLGHVREFRESNVNEWDVLKLTAWIVSPTRFPGFPGSLARGTHQFTQMSWLQMFLLKCRIYKIIVSTSLNQIKISTHMITENSNSSRIRFIFSDKFLNHFHHVITFNETDLSPL